MFCLDISADFFPLWVPVSSSLALNSNRSSEKSQVFHREKEVSVLYLSVMSLLCGLQIYITKMGELR